MFRCACLLCCVIDFLKGWQTLIVGAIVIAGWYKISSLDRKNEKFKKYFDYRIKTLEEALELLFTLKYSKEPFEDIPDLSRALHQVRTKIQLVGNDDEYELIENLIITINTFTHASDEDKKSIHEKYRITLDNLFGDYAVEARSGLIVLVS